MKPLYPRMILLVAAIQFWPMVALAQSIQVSGAVALDGAVNCFATHDYWVTVTTGPCSDYIPPQQVRIGETFQANGQTLTINVIEAFRADEDMPDVGLKAGQWMCSAAESIDDLPTATKSGTTWLNILDCEPQQ